MNHRINGYRNGWRLSLTSIRKVRVVDPSFSKFISTNELRDLDSNSFFLLFCLNSIQKELIQKNILTLEVEVVCPIIEFEFNWVGFSFPSQLLRDSLQMNLG